MAYAKDKQHHTVKLCILRLIEHKLKQIGCQIEVSVFLSTGVLDSISSSTHMNDDAV